MSTKTHHHLCPESVRKHNQKLDRYLRSRCNVTLFTYKSIRYLAQIAAMYVLVEAINKGADPLIAIIIAGVIIGGPDVLEYIAVREDYVDYQDQQGKEGK